MIFETIINGIKEKFITTGKDNWIPERLYEMEEHRDNFDTLPFKIIELKDFGFLTKVKGLYSYISFYHMPWKYVDTESWIAIAPCLIGKKFYCKIHKVDKDPIAIILNGELPQFKKVELTIGQEYNGLIIKKVDYGFFIDIGNHFDWSCGSVIGLMHKSQIANSEDLTNHKIGEQISIIYQGLNDNGQYLFSNDREKTDWQLGAPQGLIGEIMWAKVVRKENSNQIDLLIRGIYKAKLSLDKSQSSKYKRKLKQLKNGLVNGQIVNCEILEANDKNKTLKVKWLAEIDTDIELDNSLINNLDKETITNLIKVKNRLSD